MTGDDRDGHDDRGQLGHAWILVLIIMTVVLVLLVGFALIFTNTATVP